MIICTKNENENENQRTLQFSLGCHGIHFIILNIHIIPSSRNLPQVRLQQPNAAGAANLQRKDCVDGIGAQCRTP